MISAVLLAAGKSERMGKFKQLLPIGGKTFVEACADNLLASRVSEVIVVTGYNHLEVKAALADRPVLLVENPEYESGMASSIKRGLEFVNSDSSGILIALSDQPLITPDVLNQIISAYEDAAPLILIPVYAGKKGHPIILSPTLKPQIMSMDSEVGLRQVISANADFIYYLEVANESVLLDFDYPEDLVRLPGGSDGPAPPDTTN